MNVTEQQINLLSYISTYADYQEMRAAAVSGGMTAQGVGTNISRLLRGGYINRNDKTGNIILTASGRKAWAKIGNGEDALNSPPAKRTYNKRNNKAATTGRTPSKRSNANNSLAGNTGYSAPNAEWDSISIEAAAKTVQERKNALNEAIRMLHYVAQRS